MATLVRENSDFNHGYDKAPVNINGKTCIKERMIDKWQCCAAAASFWALRGDLVHPYEAFFLPSLKSGHCIFHCTISVLGSNMPFNLEASDGFI